MPLDEMIQEVLSKTIMKVSFESFAAFQLQSSWDEVAAKAKRLVMDNQVTVLRNSPSHIMGHVVGDHGEYNSEIARDDPSSNVISAWNCECPWNQFAFDRTRKWKYLEGRVCSHVLSLYWKAKGTPLDMSEEAPGFQAPKGQTPGASPGQQSIPNQEPVDLHPGQEKTQQPPVTPQALPTNKDITMGPQPKSPLPQAQQPPQKPQLQQLQLFDITAPPGMQPNPQGSPVSVPGARPPTPGNPVQFPGTFSHFIPTFSVKDYTYATDELTAYFEQQRSQGMPIYVALTQPVTLELRGGKQPMPGAQSVGTSSEGVPMYSVMDLGFNPETGERENANVNELSGAPEQTGTYADAPAGKQGEVIDFNAQMKLAYVMIPLNYPQGEDCRLHPHSLVGWVDYASLRGLPTKLRSPYRKRL